MATSTQVNTKPATAKPKGVTITRNGNKLNIKWTISSKNYGAGQQLQWKVRGTDWTDVTPVGVATTAKSINFPASRFYPNAGKPVSEKVYFRLRGRRAPFTDTKGVHWEPAWSEWTTKEYDWKLPHKPSISAALSDTYANVTTFSWTTSTSTTDQHHFTDVEYQTILVKECKLKFSEGSKAPWKSSTLGWATGTTTANSSRTYTEDTEKLAADSYTRWVRVRSRGCRGASSYPDEKNWSYSRHVYARPYQATEVKAAAKTTDTGGFACTVSWKAGKNEAHPIDQVSVEYAISVPQADMSCPSGASWTEATVIKDTSDVDKVTFNIDDNLSVDECLYVRVNTKHDRNITYGIPKLAKAGFLDDPTGITVTNIDNAYHTADVTATQNATVSGAFLAVTYRAASKPGKDFVCGILTGSTTPPYSATIQGPNWDNETSFAFGVQAIVGSYSSKTRADGATAYTLNKKMVSQNYDWSVSTVPVAPSNVSAVPADTQGAITVGWDWSWDDATAAELSWADHEDAWGSTDGPQTYTVANRYAAQWNIGGLETGKLWYVRVRLVSGEGDSATYGPYGDTQVVDLSSSPAKPVMMLTPAVVTEDGSFTASWGYVSTDGTPQATAEIRGYEVGYELTTDVTVDPDKIYYELDVDDPSDPDEPSEIEPNFVVVENPVDADIGTYYERVETTSLVIFHMESQQSATITPADFGWSAGTEQGLQVRVWSASGKVSEWSDEVYIRIASPLTATISASSLTTVTVVDDADLSETHTVTAMTVMPLTLTVTGAGAGGTTTIAIERAESYYVDRPDETTFNGHTGETVALVSQTGEAQITIGNDDLIGPLDDGAAYRIIATVQDGLGQSAEVEEYFEIHWAHQALIPDATVAIDTTYNVAKITPIQPAGTQAGDTFDIYRLSVDRPQLIVEGGDWGTTYVDPYPALGIFGGHRIVFRTADGDYITQDRTMAWVDLGEAEGDILTPGYSIIEFDGHQIPLRYDQDVSNSWEKDFRETRYLGGSVQGDWNAAVGRSGSVSAAGIVATEPETITAMRRLATWPGICHVRTLDGSSYAADVQVSETYSSDRGQKFAEFSLSITRVDPESLEGLTLTQWEEGNESE